MLGCAGRRGGAVALVCRIPAIGCRQLACAWCSLLTLKQVMGRGCAYDYDTDTRESMWDSFASLITSLLAVITLVRSMTSVISWCFAMVNRNDEASTSATDKARETPHVQEKLRKRKEEEQHDGQESKDPRVKAPKCWGCEGPHRASECPYILAVKGLGIKGELGTLMDLAKTKDIDKTSSQAKKNNDDQKKRVDKGDSQQPKEDKDLQNGATWKSGACIPAVVWAKLQGDAEQSPMDLLTSDQAVKCQDRCLPQKSNLTDSDIEETTSCIKHVSS